MNELALFAGAGGGLLAGKLLGWRTVCAVENDGYAASVLVARQNDGTFPTFPIWDDVQTFDGHPWRGVVDVISGGFPCQNISSAGDGTGLAGDKSRLWFEFARIIREVRPQFVFVENSPNLVSRGLGTVLAEMAEMGYDANWCVLSAADAIWSAGNPCVDHKRDRIWVVGKSREGANPNGLRQSQPQGRVSKLRRRPGNIRETVSHPGINGREPRRSDDQKHVGAESGPGCEHDNACANANSERCNGGPGQSGKRGRFEFEDGSPQDANPNGPGLEKQLGTIAARAQLGTTECHSWWKTEPGMGRVVNGVGNRTHRIRVLGNGQVPHTAAMAWRILIEAFQK